MLKISALNERRLLFPARAREPGGGQLPPTTHPLPPARPLTTTLSQQVAGYARDRRRDITDFG